jgi:predicted nucleic acid-binding protein
VRITVDSNVLAYAIDIGAGERHSVASGLLTKAAEADCVLTLQSLAEFFRATTRKAKLSTEEAEFFIDRWRAVFPVFSAGEQTLVEAIQILRQHGCSFWDALLWATARQAGCRLLLSEDMHDGQTLGGVTIVNPFAPKNAVLLAAVLP